MDRKPFKVDKNGTKYYADYTCQRCGGQGGADQWKFTGWTCYDCGGSGIASKPYVWKEYTPEYEAKLNAQREKRFEKKRMLRKAQSEELNRKFFADNGFNSDGKTYVALGNTYEIKDELKEKGFRFNKIAKSWTCDHVVDGVETAEISVEEVYYSDFAGVYDWTNNKKVFFIDGELVDESVIEDMDFGFTWEWAFEYIVKQKNAERAKDDHPYESQYIGNVGDKVEVVLTIDRVVECEFHPVSYKTITSYLYIMHDEKGNKVNWKSSEGIWKKTGDHYEGMYGEGDKVTLKGTIKELSSYKGEKQTVLTRCKVKEV